MDYPLNKEELKEVEFCIEKIYTDSFDLSTYMLEQAHHYAFEFLIRYGYLKVTDLSGKAINEPQRWITESVMASFSSPKDKLIDEIKSCNAKAKANIKREWKIGISSAAIGGIFAVIGSVISSYLKG